MRYRNRITGVEFTTASRISGADFEEVTPKVYAPKEPKKAPEEPAKKEEKAPKKAPIKRAKK